MRQESELQLAEMIGVPEFFMTTVVTEAAGGGCVRVYNCIERRGLLIPQCSVVVPATALLGITTKVRAAASDMFREAMAVGSLAH